jgi:NifU-like protein involved in Fe-S cluster formation
MLKGEAVDADRLGDLRALGGVSRFPARHSCALMAWRALDAALADA